MVLVEPMYCYLTNHCNGTSRTYKLLLDIICISPFLTPLVFTIPHSHCFTSPTSRLHILCLLVVTFLSVVHFISIITITGSIFEVIIPIKVRLLIILSVPHIMFLFPPFLLCCHLYKYKSSQQNLLVNVLTISNVCANSNKNFILR